jgi:hypothetical protein
MVKSSVFWDLSPCSLVEVNLHFGGGTYGLYLQCQSLSQARNQREAGSKQSRAGIS